MYSYCNSLGLRQKVDGRSLKSMPWTEGPGEMITECHENTTPRVTTLLATEDSKLHDLIGLLEKSVHTPMGDIS